MIIYNKTDQWKFLPFNSAQLTFVNCNDIFRIEKLTKGSGFSLEPIVSKTKTNEGFDRIAGFKFFVQILVSQNNFGDFQLLLELLGNDDISMFSADLNDGTKMKIITKNTSYVNKISASWKIVYKDEYVGPELQITMKGLFSKDMIQSDKFIFEQYWN